MAIFLEKMKIFGNFFEKNENFWQFFWKKCQVFGNFFTVKCQFSGGTEHDASFDTVANRFTCGVTAYADYYTGYFLAGLP